MNDTVTNDQLLPTESVLLQNGYIRSQGKFKKRSGTLLVGNDTGSTSIVGQTSWTTPSGTKYFLRMTGTNLQYLDGSTWTTMDSGFTTGLPTEFVAANGKLYIFNGTEIGRSNMESITVDGTSLQKVKVTFDKLY